MQQPIEFHKLFYTPIWRYAYPTFAEEEEQLVEYFTQDKLYVSQRERNGLQITGPDLHKDEAIANLVKWIQECLESTMTLMGLRPECGITSMWATRQKAQGFHHPHSHGNSFLGGVMHLYDADDCACGTIFNNSEHTKYVITPPEMKDSNPMLRYAEHLRFLPGTLLIFPAWAEHMTVPTDSRYRVVVALNSMPIGMTNNDHFDRYNFPEPSNMQLFGIDD